MRQNYSKAKGLGITQAEYRKAYARWKASIRRGNKVPLIAFIRLKRVKCIKSKATPRAYFHARSALERALATPKWVNIEAICEFYANRPKGYHVDHIVPIKGKNVCGL